MWITANGIARIWAGEEGQVTPGIRRSRRLWVGLNKKGLPLSTMDGEEQQEVNEAQGEERGSRSEEECGPGQTWLEGVRRWGGRKRKHRRTQKSTVQTKKGTRGRKGESEEMSTQRTREKGRRRGGPWTPQRPGRRIWEEDDSERRKQEEIRAGWRALLLIEEADDRATKELRKQMGGQNWTPRDNFSPEGTSPAATGGLWAMGSPQELARRMQEMNTGDYLVVATDGAMTKVMETNEGRWEAPPHMGGGWAVGITQAGTDVELVGTHKVEWIAAGAVRVELTSWGVKASSYLAESGGMVAALRALTTASSIFSSDKRERRPNVRQYCDSESLVKSIEGRMKDKKAARNSATRVWWPEIAMMLKWWREGGAKWEVKWRRGHVERRFPNSKDWAPADWGNVIADLVAGQGWNTEVALLPGIVQLQDYCFDETRAPGGKWTGWLQDDYGYDDQLKCFRMRGQDRGLTIHGPIDKSMQEMTAMRAGNTYVEKRLGLRIDKAGQQNTEIWDPRPHQGRGGKGTIAEAVWKLKLVWDHAGSGTVRSRDINQQVGRAEKRLAKLNEVEAGRLLLANESLSHTMRQCREGVEAVEARKALDRGRTVAADLRETRSSKAKSRQLEQEAKEGREAAAEEEAGREQEEQEAGEEGARLIRERGVEVQQQGLTILAGLVERDPGWEEEIRQGDGTWRRRSEEQTSEVVEGRPGKGCVAGDICTMEANGHHCSRHENGVARQEREVEGGRSSVSGT